MEDEISERLIKFEKELAALTQEYTPNFQEAVALNLSPIELQIFRDAMPLYSPETGRWYDPWGVPDSVLDFKYVLQNEGVPEREQLLAMAVLFYHDSGYETREESADYATKEQRETHMQTGALIASLGLRKIVDSNEHPIFSNQEIDAVYEAVLHHDDKYLGTNFQSRLLHIFIDGDTIFVPSFVSAYKDYVSRYGRPESAGGHDMIDAIQFLRMRQSCFFRMGEEKIFGQEIQITPDSNEKYGGKILPIKFNTTRKVIAAHMLARTKEFRDGSFYFAYMGDWNNFKPFAEDYFQGPIEAAKQGKSYDRLRFG